MWRNPYTGVVDRGKGADLNLNYYTHFMSDDPWYDVLNPLVVENEVNLLKKLRSECPGIDDILVYTYDQDAWQAKEFGNSKHSRGIPLHERLPGYLSTLHQVWIEGREEQSMMWWEPLELSAGQIYKCLPRLPRRGFGLMLHSNIAEVQIAKPVDVWFRNTARMASELGIPVVGEGFFCSWTEEIEPLALPCPRLVDEQFRSITGVDGIVGIKEYYGVLSLIPDLNLDLLRARLTNPNASTPALLKAITKRFDDAQEDVLRVIELLADAMQLFPWDASWFARVLGKADPDHGWSAATIRGQICETPSWDSTRRAHFMMTDDRQPHPFLLEDVQLRCEVVVERLLNALATIRKLLPQIRQNADRAMFEGIARDADHFMRVSRSYALHLRETNIAEMLRGDLKAGRPMMPRLVEEMNRLLEADAENQHRQGRVMDMLKKFKDDPTRFLKEHLIPTEKTIYEKGYHTLTTR